MRLLLSRQYATGMICLVAIAALTLSGCGKPNPFVTVSGKVTYKGKPLGNVMLAFEGPGTYNVASVLEDGTFIMTDVMPGEQKVKLMASPGGSGSSSPEEAAKMKKAPARPVDLPSKYYDASTSGVKVTVKGETTGLEVNID